MGLRMRAIVLALTATLTAECSRTPVEEFPTAPLATATGAVTSAAWSASSAAPRAADAPAAGRCIRPTPDAPPARVAPGPAPGCPRDPEGPQKVPVVGVGFPDATAGSVAVDAELVSTEHDTTRGLMYRTSMPEERGMLFDLRSREDHQFWMHNTCIPLDLFYIDRDGLLVGIVESAPTLDDMPRGVGCPSVYVLETNAGWARRHGVKAGQHVNLPREVLR